MSYVPLRTGCIVDDQLVVLDRCTSRYFLVPGIAAAPSSTGQPPDCQSSILSWYDDRPLLRSTARQCWVPRARSDVRPTDHRSDRASLARLWLLEQKSAARLRHGLDAGLGVLEKTPVGRPDPARRTRLIGSAWRSTRIWSARDRCLPRSLALARALRSSGSAAALVIGVALRPFAAHAWVQEDHVVVNDTLDRVLLFTPILVSWPFDIC